MAVETRGITIPTGGGGQVPAKIEVDTDTGASKLLSSDGREYGSISESTDYEWTFKKIFFKDWNDETGDDLTRTQFEDDFKSGAIGNFKRIQKKIANIINNNSSESLRDRLKDNLFLDVKGSQNTTSDETTGQSTEALPENELISNEGNGISNLNAAPSSETSSGQEEPGEKKELILVKYPTAMPDDMNKLKIRILKFESSDISTEDFGVGSRTEAAQKGDPIATIFLPIPGNVQDANQVSWGRGDMNALEIAMADFALTTINAAAANENVFDKAKEYAKRVAQKFEGGGTKIAAEAIANLLAGSAVGIGAQLQQRKSGQIINPNAELLFNGPSLRQFGFSFTMSARNAGEVGAIRAIIKLLKINMAPALGEKKLFLNSPNLFELSYVAGTSENDLNPFMNKFKICALTGMQVNYTPNNSFMAYDNNMPTSYGVDMQFQELEPIWQSDYNEEGNIGY
ncbi:MAG: hypothetical protein CBD74_11090 [Saprospirales bacterium TMED214]|nr:MAG: hypothetical protein CBD74_11090 [Saprospirales bacterium TMED214]